MVLVNTIKSTTTRNGSRSKATSAKPFHGPKRSSQDRGSVDANMPKAMKDPNWRSRQDTEPSGDTENGELGMAYSTSLLCPQRSRDRPSAATRHLRSSSDYSTFTSSFEEISSRSEELFTIINQVDLKPVDGHPLSILELALRPETPTPSAAVDSKQYVKVSRYPPANIMQSDSTTDSEAYSYSAKIHSRELFHIVASEQSSRRVSSSSPQSHIRESRSIYDAGTQYEPQILANFQQARIHTPTSKPCQEPSTAIRNSRDQAFQRLLQRLNRDGHQQPTTQSPQKRRNEHKQHHNEQANNFFESPRVPVHGQGRRNQTISDFKVDYWDNGLSSTTSHAGSEDTVQSSNKSNIWNPKAREFLSLGPQQNSRRPLPWQEATSVSPMKPSHSFNSLPLPNTSTWPNTAPAEFNPYALNRDAPTSINTPFNTLPSTYNPTLGLGLTPDGYASTGYLSAGSTGPPAVPPLLPFPTLSALQTPSMLPFGGLSAQQAAQQVAAQQMAALPYLASLASLGCLNPIAPALGKPNIPTHAPRPPVPKPTMPNTGEQLAYEEWIEWRKANEPGYAVECKARQQRRSQRSKGVREGDMKSGVGRPAQAQAVTAA